MVSILLSIVIGVLAYYFGKIIRDQFNIILFATMILSSITFFIDLEITTQGFLGLAFFIIVMIAGALPKGSTLNKRFRAVRKEYSILGFVVLLPHVIKYGLMFLDGSYPVEWFGVISYLVMIPLFITSFSYFKKKMDIKSWVKLQKWAYLVYTLTFIHLLLIGESEHIFAYIIIYSVYVFLKLFNYVFKNENASTNVIKSSMITGIVIVVSLVLSGTIDLSELKENNGDNAEITATSFENLEDGTFKGYGTGFQNMDVEVDVVVENGIITDIIVYEYGATSPNRGMDFEAAGDQIVIDILNEQSLDVDTISGATYTTSGILEAVEDALSK